MRILRRALSAAAPWAVLVIPAVLLLSVFEPVSVSGGSMVPALYPGDLVLVRRTAPPVPGSIALIRSGARSAVLHRVVACQTDGMLTTRGDANAVDDLVPVRTEEVCGTVTVVVPAGRLIDVLLGGERHATLAPQSKSSKL